MYSSICIDGLFRLLAIAICSRESLETLSMIISFIAIPVLRVIMTRVEYAYFCPEIMKANRLRQINPVSPSSGKMAQPIPC